LAEYSIQTAFRQDLRKSSHQIDGSTQHNCRIKVSASQQEAFMTLKISATKAIALTLATSFALTSALPVSTASAHPRNYAHNHGGHKVIKHHKKHKVVRHHRKYKHRNNGGDALAAGILGFAIGAIIADHATRPRTVYVQPETVYVAPQPVYREPYVQRRPLNDPYATPRYSDRSYDDDRYDDGPRVIRYEDEVSTTYEPWTPQWARWCDNNYRSFNINTGTFRGYDGKDHFCVVK
jgi:hypothetical protein